jgi:hypothetical protein
MGVLLEQKGLASINNPEKEACFGIPQFSLF